MRTPPDHRFVRRPAHRFAPGGCLIAALKAGRGAPTMPARLADRLAVRGRLTNMHEPMQGTTSAEGLRLAIVASRYHHEITANLQRGAIEAFEQAGGERDHLTVVPAPGAFELIAVSAALVRRPEIDGVAALGCVIRGETPHDQHICQAVSEGLQHLIVKHGKPISFGLLTCLNIGQARARAGGEHGNKGEEAMTALIESLGVIRWIERGGGRS